MKRIVEVELRDTVSPEVFARTLSQRYGGVVSARVVPTFDIELTSSGDGWIGTFGIVVNKLVEDITDDGPYGPVEVTLSDGTMLTGTLDTWMGEDAFTIAEVDSLTRIIEVNDVVRMRA